MKTANDISGFDVLKMKEDIQAAIYEDTKDMTFEELDAYHKQRIASSPIMSVLVRKFTEAEDHTPVFARHRKAVLA